VQSPGSIPSRKKGRKETKKEGRKERGRQGGREGRKEGGRKEETTYYSYVKDTTHKEEKGGREKEMGKRVRERENKREPE
jgi:hypothetical protein